MISKWSLRTLAYSFESKHRSQVKMFSHIRSLTPICMGYLPSVRSRWLDIGQVLFCVFMDRDEVEVHKHAKKERGQYPAILIEQTWSIKDLLYGFRGNFASVRDTAGSPERVRWLHLARSGSQSQRAIWFILPAHGASHIINISY